MKIKYGELHQIFDSAHYHHRRDEEFSGFRWVNCSKVMKIIRDRMVKIRKSGKMTRDTSGELIIYGGMIEEVMGEARDSIIKKSARTTERLGDDNGWGANCLLFIDRLESTVMKEVQRRLRTRLK